MYPARGLLCDFFDYFGKDPNPFVSVAQKSLSTEFNRILEEVTLPGTKTSSRRTLLYADLYIPNRDLIVEVHGEQHFKFNSFFHKDKMAFFKAQARDKDKRAWCHKYRLPTSRYSRPWSAR